jgi:ABC-type tungstate transport system permease subunit
MFAIISYITMYYAYNNSLQFTITGFNDGESFNIYSLAIVICATSEAIALCTRVAHYIFPTVTIKQINW